jgi:hypothetical protein
MELTTTSPYLIVDSEIQLSTPTAQIMLTNVSQIIENGTTNRKRERGGRGVGGDLFHGQPL